MTRFALLSEIDRLTPEQMAKVDHIIADDGEWDQARITAYINQWSGHSILHEPPADDWTKEARPL